MNVSIHGTDRRRAYISHDVHDKADCKRPQFSLTGVFSGASTHQPVLARIARRESPTIPQAENQGVETARNGKQNPRRRKGIVMPRQLTWPLLKRRAKSWGKMSGPRLASYPIQLLHACLLFRGMSDDPHQFTMHDWLSPLWDNLEQAAKFRARGILGVHRVNTRHQVSISGVSMPGLSLPLLSSSNAWSTDDGQDAPHTSALPIFVLAEAVAWE